MLPSALNFKSFFRSLEQFFLSVGQNNFGNKIPFSTPFSEWNSDWVNKTPTLHKVFQFCALRKWNFLSLFFISLFRQKRKRTSKTAVCAQYCEESISHFHYSRKCLCFVKFDCQGCSWEFVTDPKYFQACMKSTLPLTILNNLLLTYKELSL